MLIFKSFSICSSPLKSMEEMWNDINLSSLHHPHRSSSTTTTAQTFHFQDLFSKPLLSYKDQPPPNDVSSAGDTISFGFGSLSQQRTSLSLNSDSELGFKFLETSAFLVKKPALDSPACDKKRVQQNSDDSSEVKRKRLMKNRESAARSRARKQAYTNELEHKVAHLRKENARIKNQLTQFYLAAPTALEVPKKRTLYRTLTAPF
ncbi:bZIP transcription factor 27 [Morus notabilis]|uniref:bZIP transcription factor 27 n=1 Tax=Morus notabilis TaxID=981085 RepID=UPI000CED20DE|nr:bZIP transcription factor 27 [Morus notabilis]